jgi:hypothetical protein
LLIVILLFNYIAFHFRIFIITFFITSMHGIGLMSRIVLRSFNLFLIFVLNFCFILIMSYYFLRSILMLLFLFNRLLEIHVHWY